MPLIQQLVYRPHLAWSGAKLQICIRSTQRSAICWTALADIQKVKEYLEVHPTCKWFPKDPITFQMVIGVYNHLLRKVFRFHYHSQKVIGSLGVSNHCDRFRPLNGVYSFSLPNGLFMAYKWRLLTTYKSWDEPPSTAFDIFEQRQLLTLGWHEPWNTRLVQLPPSLLAKEIISYIFWSYNLLCTATITWTLSHHFWMIEHHPSITKLLSNLRI